MTAATGSPRAGAMALSAASVGLYCCAVCGLVSQVRPHDHHDDERCPRCNSRLHRRKPDSIMRTWALLIAAYMLYLPANLLPIMETTTFGSTQQDTIFSGIVYLWVTDSWVLASVVFVASLLVPLLKMFSLTYLLISVQTRSSWQPVQRTQLYRVLEFVGRWSMLDIYVVTLLVALVQIKSLATVSAGPGAMAFGAVVVLTMLAALSFDPRLIWDAVPSAAAPRSRAAT